MLLYSEACERNKEPIASVLVEEFRVSRRVLEIGSGTGQHAAFFADRLGHLTWQPSDVACNLPALRARAAQNPADNLEHPIALDVTEPDWPVIEELAAPDAIFTANTLHIMSWDAVMDCWSVISKLLLPAGRVCIYGPFRYDGEFTSRSNASFDQSLRMRDTNSGIRDFEAVAELARQHGLICTRDLSMPANNQLLVFERDATAL
jgi:SAM-dependent methyltransferase